MPELRLRGGEVDGLDLHYLVEGRGPAVVLVHGLGGFAESWRHTLRGLAARTTVYALDLPGFGASAKPRTRAAPPGRSARRSPSSSTSDSRRGPPPRRARRTSPRSATCGRTSKSTRRTTAARSRPSTSPSC